MSTYIFETDEERFVRCHRDAQGYHRRAVLFAEQRQSPSLVFNVAAIAVENYLIALCARHGNMPFNHNYSGLLAAVTELMPLPEALCRSIRHLDSIFGICSVDNYHHATPGIEDKQAVLAICAALSALFTTTE